MHKFYVDYSVPAGDNVFDPASFEKFLHDRIKVEGKPGQLGDVIQITKECELRGFSRGCSVGQGGELSLWLSVVPHLSVRDDGLPMSSSAFPSRPLAFPCAEPRENSLTSTSTANKLVLTSSIPFSKRYLKVSRLNFRAESGYKDGSQP